MKLALIVTLLSSALALAPCYAQAAPEKLPGNAAREFKAGPPQDGRWLYVGRAPKDRDGFRQLAASLEIYDIAYDHKLARVIPLTVPDGTAAVNNLRGIMASTKTGKLYLSHHGEFKEAERGKLMRGWLLCLDLKSEKILWNRQYESNVDRGAITQDGQTIYLPAGEYATTPYYYRVDAKTGAEKPNERIEVGLYTHNTIVAPDGKHVFMTAFGPIDKGGFEPYVSVADAKTGQIVHKVGPFANMVRPITVNGDGSLLFATVNRLVGFQVGDVKSGKVLFTVSAPPEYAPDDRNVIFSHGISMTGDEKEIWVVDQKQPGVHWFDVSGLPQNVPIWKGYLKTHNGREKDAQGQTLYGEQGIYGQPGWIMSSYSGDYLYLESGEIIDTKAHQVIGNLIGANGKYVHSRYAIEIDWQDGAPLRAGDQQGVGRVSAK